MSNPIHIQTALLSAMLSHQPISPDRDTLPAGILVKALNRAVNDLENQGPRSERIALQLLEALARYEFEDHLERALKSDLDLEPYEDTCEETEELPPSLLPAQALKAQQEHLAQKQAENFGITPMHIAQRDAAFAGNRMADIRRATGLDDAAVTIITNNLRAGKGSAK